MKDTKILIANILSRKMSKYRIAKECGVSWATVQFWYKGVFRPNDENYRKLKRLAEWIEIK